MKAAKGYAQYLEWDRIATAQKWQPEWAEELGLAVGRYLNECTAYGKTPTFDGLFDYLKKICPKEAANHA